MPHHLQSNIAPCAERALDNSETPLERDRAEWFEVRTGGVVGHADWRRPDERRRVIFGQSRLSDMPQTRTAIRR
jgi:hypothetical protein